MALQAYSIIKLQLSEGLDDEREIMEEYQEERCFPGSRPSSPDDIDLWQPGWHVGKSVRKAHVSSYTLPMVRVQRSAPRGQKKRVLLRWPLAVDKA